MKKHSSTKNNTSKRRRSSRLAFGMFALAALLFIGCGVLLAYSLTARAETSAPVSRRVSVQTQQTSTITPTAPVQNTAQGATPVTKPTLPALSNNTPSTPVASPATVAATPTLIPSTPQASQTGVFPLSAGGPLPVSESILHPTNIARATLNGTLVSVYAGSLTRQPQQGVLCVLRENVATGQFTVQVYQSPRLAGALTIVSIHNTVLTITDTQGKGTFDLATNQFQW